MATTKNPLLTTAKKQHGKPFPKGTSGNPKGRPRGSRNKATLAIEALLDGQGEKLTRKAVKLALAGDTVALRVCLDRILPPRRERPITFSLPAPDKASDIPAVLASIIRGVGQGKLTPGEAGTLAALLQTQVRIIESANLEQRITDLENRVQEGVNGT